MPPSLKQLAALALATLACAGAHAYKVGDSVDPALLARLQIDPAKVTVIDFFAEWCISCRKELPLISGLHGRVDRKQVDFVGVDTNDSLKGAEAFQKEMRAKGGLSFRAVNDPEQLVVNNFKPRGYPALYVLRDGKVVREHIGAMPNVDVLLEQDLKALGVH